MRDILVHVPEAEAWGSHLRYASMLASALHARLTGLDCPQTEPQPMFAGSNAIAVADSKSHERAIKAAWAKEESFLAYVGSLGVKHGAWVVHDGHALQAMQHLAHWHDLLVLDREDAMRRPGAMLGPLQLASQLPCMIVPGTWVASMPPVRAVVLWDGSLSSIRTLHAAVPLLEWSLRVILLTGGGPGSVSSEPGSPPFDLDRYCDGHELQAERNQLHQDWSAADVVHEVLAADADLLVMGSHGRTRMSNRLLDHRTLHVLEHCPVPVLLRH